MIFFVGAKQDHVGAREFILRHMYLSQIPDPDRQVYSHFTCATGTTVCDINFFLLRIAILLAPQNQNYLQV